MTYLYVCRFTNSVIKVGRAIDPDARIAQHEARVSCMGVAVETFDVAECVGDVVLSEAALIEQCCAGATSRFKNEWFGGLDFAQTREWMLVVAATAFVKPAVIPRSTVGATPENDRVRRYRCEWVDGKHYWVDAEPQQAHWPEGVMRWDLRQSDWHLIWPELVDHPCAYLFAPKHPSRGGAPVFSDWVRSWGAVTDKRELLLNMPTRGVEIARAIWPELADAEQAQAAAVVAEAKAA